MEEYVKLSLDTYEYFRELEQNKKLKSLAECVKSCVTNETGRPVVEGFRYIREITIDQDKLTSMLQKAFGSTIKWE